MFAEFCRNGLH